MGAQSRLNELQQRDKDRATSSAAQDVQILALKTDLRRAQDLAADADREVRLC